MAASPLAGVAVSALVLFAPTLVAAQGAPEEWLERLEAVMPDADRFTDRRGQPPVFEAYGIDPASAQETLVGYVFLTSDLPPEQMGFNGPIEVLVGMDLQGVLTGIVVSRYNESLRSFRGDFLATDGFQEQFSGKSIVDAFQVRRDVDGITGATITVDAMSRGIRNAAREVALAYRLGSVSSASEAPTLDPISVALSELERLSWTQMLLRGMVQQILVLDDERTVADLTLLYLRDEGVAEMMIGSSMLADVLERAGSLAQERHLVLAGVDGPSAGALNLARLAIVQDGDTIGLETAEVLLFGPPREGKLDGQVRMARVLLIDRVVDMTRPFTYVLDLRPGLGVFSAEYPGVRRRPPRIEGGGVEGDTDLSPPATGVPASLAALLALLLFAAAALVVRWVRAGR